MSLKEYYSLWPLRNIVASIHEKACLLLQYFYEVQPVDHSKGALTLAFVGPFRLLRLAYLTFFVSRQERWKRVTFFRPFAPFAAFLA